MNYDAVAQQIASYHDLIQTKPRDRLDFINKTKEVKQVILRCVAYLDELYGQEKAWFFPEEDFARIHESVCVSAVPLLDMVEHYTKKAEAETRERHFAV